MKYNAAERKKCMCGVVKGEVKNTNQKKKKNKKTNLKRHGGSNVTVFMY